jgi:putative ABC transport system ATP-binding protein
MPAPLIELKRVTKIFTTKDIETHVLSDVDLAIDSGEYVAVAGPSGCGKSTLLSILGLLDVPTAGDYLLDGTPLQGLRPIELARMRNQRVGFVFQSFNLIGDLTVAENVAIPLLYRGVTNEERLQAVDDALRRVGMQHRAKHHPSELSGGQQQRVAVARAIVGKPSILLADEPTGNLDSKNGAVVMDLIRELHAAGATICMVTHDPRYAEHADRTIRLFDGRLSHAAGEMRLESVS